MATPPVRDRLLMSAITLLRSKGADGFGMSELMAHSGVARRSMYQHFPEGKAELLEAATAEAGRFAGALLARALADMPTVAGLTAVAEQWKRILVESDYDLGCPLVAAATAAAEYPAAAHRAATAFADMSRQVADAFARDGLPAAQAAHAGEMLVAALEGAIITARAQRSTAPLDALVAHVHDTWGRPADE
ncbi:MAG: helix-turn-helix domain-containing protein [Gordonia sp. (in: high G+C Gram-positive bacteria)]|uniref:TetR/AcrR family transcriptional regulator n=1 Tax=Gordonia sp. (in: high G+C Gram-positive bacteria) TaxID=84139 RepID=UPI003C722050